MQLCCRYGLQRHLDAELLNANLVHRVGTVKGNELDFTPPAFRKFAVISQLYGVK
jgi:hypothetical protein